MSEELVTDRKRRTPYRQMGEGRRLLEATVLRTRRPSPNMIEVTVGGPELRHFGYLGADHMFRLFFRRREQGTLRLPSRGGRGWMAGYMLQSASTRPLVRFYTVRRFRPDAMEMDIEFVRHGDTAPASYWADSVRSGERVGIYDEGRSYPAEPIPGRRLLVGDESALPAILAILEQAPPTLQADALIEVPHTTDIRFVAAPEGVNLQWLPRDDPGARPGQLALRTLSAIERPDLSYGHAFLAGESGLVTQARRFLVNQLGMPRTDIKFLGYWKHGQASR